MVDALLRKGIERSRLKSDDPELGGCWVLELRDTDRNRISEMINEPP